MIVLLLVSTVLSLVVSAALSARLLHRGVSQRRLPELALGASFLSAGVIGWVLMLAGIAGAGEGASPAAGFLGWAGHVFISFGFILNYIFTFSVFRREQPWALGFLAMMCGLVAITALTREVPAGSSEAAWVALTLSVRVLAGVWGAFESFLYHRRMRRRLLLGMADPVVVNRFWLWGLASGFTAVVSIVGKVAGNSPGSETPLIAVGGLTVTVAVLQWMVFFPPARYERWLARRWSSRADSAPA